ncbi:hypothetical protein OSB04_024018 [Centaurea solstitialis]|uniref:Uncharacterized protein n=1 Tax=Centaurea solstitialis TaxID=347529 RepID=A0AA38WDH0_9ASTR|nr:hypothetical protein OSB04_024018 [Centaurea solstitialis]
MYSLNLLKWSPIPHHMYSLTFPSPTIDSVRIDSWKSYSRDLAATQNAKSSCKNSSRRTCVLILISIWYLMLAAIN